MVWGCFAASGPGRLAVINGTMNSAVYQKILKDNVRPSVRDLKLKRTWVLQQHNDSKHTSKSTSEWLKKNKMKTLELPSQSPDLNPIEMLWHDLKKAVHAQKPSNVAELQQFCQDEWAKIPPQCCNCHGSARLSPPSITTIRITWVLIMLTCTSSPLSSTQYKSTRHSSLSVRSRTHDVDSTPATIKLSIYLTILTYWSLPPVSALCVLLSRQIVCLRGQCAPEDSPVLSAHHICGQKDIHYI